ncbi:MAG: tripartite tricarboxylate transporter TctB family protein [Bacillota bacterium]
MPNIIVEKLDFLMSKYRKYGELIVAVVLFIFFSGMRIFIGNFMNLSVERWRFVSPAFWPGWILLFGAILSAFFIYNAYKRLQAEQENDFLDKLPEEDKTGKREEALRERFQKEGKILSLKELEILADAKTKTEDEQATSSEIIRMVSVIGSVFIYLYLIRIMGFITSTLIFSFLYLILLKERRPLLLGTAPIVLVAVIYFMFTQLLVVPLPRGVGIFQMISNFFY